MKLILKTMEVTVIDHLATGKAARQFRKSKGVSLREVARQIGISAPFLSDLELGRRNWSEGLVNRFQWAINRTAAPAKTNPTSWDRQNDEEVNSTLTKLAKVGKCFDCGKRVKLPPPSQKGE